MDQGKIPSSNFFLDISIPKIASWGWKGILKLWGWKGILKLRDMVLPLVPHLIGNGTATSFWHDPWFKDGTLISLCGARAIYDSRMRARVMVSQFVMNDAWNLPPPKSSDLILAWRKIADEVVTVTDFNDVVWIAKKSGKFTLKSAYNYIHKYHLYAKPNWVEWIWFRGCIKKFFVLLDTF